MRTGRTAILTVVLLLAYGATGVGAHASKHRRSSRVVITVLSGRADLVSGGSALIAISPARDHRRLTVKLNGHRVTRRFAVRHRGLFKGRFAGLVRGLRRGRNVLRATLPNGAGAKITLFNHPKGGPLFAGPQPEPWTCEPGATDKKCDMRASYRYEYMSTDSSKSGFQPYDPSNPPSDVATTTTDQGIKVPFIVRIETGYVDRDQYRVASLYQPGKRWSAFSPQKQWNHKLLIMHGASCGVEYQTVSAPDVTGSSNPTSGTGPSALGRAG